MSNGSFRVSDKFRSFLEANGISLNTSAPYHPSSNGLVELAVQILKNGLKKVHEGPIPLKTSTEPAQLSDDATEYHR